MEVTFRYFKRIAFFALLFIINRTTYAQTEMDLGLKAGFNSTHLTANFNSERILAWHFGAFFRFGGRIFIQPEAYFNSKGGEISEIIDQSVTSFDLSSFDVPALAGIRILKKGLFNIHAVSGPVFSFITSGDGNKSELFSKQFYRNHYYGWQNGLGISYSFISLDARIEHSSRKIYSSPDLRPSENTFILTLYLNLMW